MSDITLEEAKRLFEGACADMSVTVEYRRRTDTDTTKASKGHASVLHHMVMIEFGPDRSEIETYAVGFHELGHIATAPADRDALFRQLFARTMLNKVPGTPREFVDEVLVEETLAWDWAEQHAPAGLREYLPALRAQSMQSYESTKALRAEELKMIADHFENDPIKVMAYQMYELLGLGDDGGCGKCPACLKRKDEKAAERLSKSDGQERT